MAIDLDTRANQFFVQMECKGKENIFTKAAYFNYLLPSVPAVILKKC